MRQIEWRHVGKDAAACFFSLLSLIILLLYYDYIDIFYFLFVTLVYLFLLIVESSTACEAALFQG